MNTKPSPNQPQNGAANAVNQTPTLYQINYLALKLLPVILRRWLPGGILRGRIWAAQNPTRAESGERSLKVNMTTGAWVDNETGQSGKDVISLAALIAGITDKKAAQGISKMLGLV